MKIRISIDHDLDSGDYEIKFNNLTDPGEPMELADVQAALSSIVKDFLVRVNKTDELPEGLMEVKH